MFNGFEEQEVPGTSLDVLDPVLYSRFTTRSEDAKDTVLLKRNLLTETDAGDIRATVAGLLMCCRTPEKYMPNAFIEAVHYRGVAQDSNYQIDARRITGPLDQQIDDALLFCRKNQTVAAVKVPDRREIPQFDDRAVFEAIVNAVAHRDYSIYSSKIRLFMFDDRLEIYSPGTLPNTATVESIALRQATRNELITSLLAECHIEDDKLVRKSYMEKRGDGVPVILSRSERLSGKKPRYQLIDDAELLLTIYAAQQP